MSKKDEIKMLLKLHTKELTDRGLDFVATEIEKLFEVEGKVEYVLQKGTSIGGVDIGKHTDRDIVKQLLNNCKEINPDSHYRFIKRTTTDTVIE